MLGRKKKPNFSAKAAETHGLLEFAVALLDLYADKLSNNSETHEVYLLLKEAGKAALQFDEVLNGNQRNMPANEQQKALMYLKRFAILFDRAGGHQIPKMHLMFHLIMRCGHAGNPRYYMTYKDESLNGIVARIAKACHRRCWEVCVHRKFNYMLLATGLTFDMH